MATIEVKNEEMDTVKIYPFQRTNDFYWLELQFLNGNPAPMHVHLSVAQLRELAAKILLETMDY